MKIYACQFDIAWEDKAANFAKVESMLRQIRPGRGDLVVLPEMAFTGFSLELKATAQGEPEKTERFLTKMASRFRINLIAGLATVTEDGRGRNEAVFVNETGAVAKYQKLHSFSFANEDSFFEEGDKVVVATWQGMKVVPFICYDLRFPEVFRVGVEAGAEVYTVIANWPCEREEHWCAMLKARAIENQAFVIGVNRCGQDPQLRYPGRSQILGPDGTVLADAGDAEGMISAEVEAETVSRYRDQFPALRDRRKTRELSVLTGSDCGAPRNLISRP